MSILTRYITGQFLYIFLLTVASFVVLFLIVDIFEDMNKIIEYQVPLATAIWYFATKIPYMLFVSLPLAVMLATLISLGLMSKNLELIAMRASGVGYISIITPIIACSLLISVLAFFGDEYIVPESNRINEYINTVKIKQNELSYKSEYQEYKIWIRRGNTIYYVGHFIPEKSVIVDFVILEFDDSFQLKRRIMAERAKWNGTLWRCYNMIENTYDQQGRFETSKYDVKLVSLSETPDDFMIVFAENTDQMSYRELKQYIAKLNADGYETTKYQVDLMSKLAYPFANFIMVLISVPFAIIIGRRGGISASVVVAFAIAFLYWVTYSICVSLGNAGTLPPILAAWTANILFIIGGSYMFLSVRT
ncbi:MAG: LPS export ABC transporter permease LptG [Deltaproteobacteria bacterium]|nr:LPS export ABC transporter permease LptG [Candidatus Zymogenaceae bacterium]